MIKASDSSEHLRGVLMEEAAKRWIPELHAEWRRASERWEAEGRPDHDPGAIVIGGWGTDLSRPEVRNPLKAAVEEAQRRLLEACRQKLVTGEWIANAKKNNPASDREPLDGDFFLVAQIAFNGTGYARAGRRSSRVEIFGLRIRRAADVRSEDHYILASTTAAQDEASRAESPTYSLPHKFSREKAPDQFVEWAAEQHQLGNIITQGNAIAAMAKVLGKSPKGPSENIVKAWCRKLDETWIARAGTPPSRHHS